MHASAFHYLPLAPLFFMVLVFLFVVMVSLFVMGVLGYAYEKMGVSRQHIFALLLLSLLGSYVNIPVAELPPERMSAEVEVTYMGIHYVVPQPRRLASHDPGRQRGRSADSHRPVAVPDDQAAAVRLGPGGHRDRGGDRALAGQAGAGRGNRHSRPSCRRSPRP